VAGVKGCDRKIHEGGSVIFEPSTYVGTLGTTKYGGQPGLALLKQHRVQLVDVSDMRDRNHEGAAREADHSFHVPFVVPARRAPKPVIE
jgi:hypothetical protein